jgi:hypothetical protein
MKIKDMAKLFTQEYFGAEPNGIPGRVKLKFAEYVVVRAYEELQKEADPSINNFSKLPASALDKLKKGEFEK